ncbi:magnesium/cobalt transporter CorA [Nocardioides marinquilinus]|uniref:Magnesium/cobalt transporter CorA n=1 Tax=Nocardioides marinquilinus TaxID=1210400 RepID=A0ABP9PU63_9ACTN
MIVDAAVYRDGRRMPAACAVHDYPALRELASVDGGFVWLGLHEPTEGEVAEALTAFGLDATVVRDVFDEHPRPKLTRRGGAKLLVMRSLWYVDQGDQVETGTIALVIGEDVVVSVRLGEGNQLREARHELEEHEERLEHGPLAVIHAAVEAVVDSYFEVMAELDEDVGEIEQSVFSPERTRDSERIYFLKREVAEARRAVAPLHDALQRFVDGTVSTTAPAAEGYFRELVARVRQVADRVDTLDALLSTAFDAHIAAISVQQNDDMRKISAGAALVVVPTFVAGVYGMNFDHMPELHWQLGYPFALALMAGVSALLFWFFKRSGWL